MARPKTLRGSKVLIQLESDTPGTFVAPCALTTKGIDLSAESNDFNVPDCDDPDAATWTERVVAALSAGVSGSGTLAMDSLATWREWFLSAAEKNIRVKLDATLANGGGYFAMSAVLTGLNIGGNQGELATIEVTIASNGEVTWTDAAA
jgi:predicted secreted protein